MPNLDYSKFLRKLYIAFNAAGNNGKVMKVNTSTGSPEFFDVTVTSSAPKGTGGTPGKVVTRVGNNAVFINLEPTAPLDYFEGGRVAYMGLDGPIYPGNTGRVTGLITTPGKYRLGANGTLVAVPNPLPVGYPDTTLLNATTKFMDGFSVYQDGTDMYLYFDATSLVLYSSGVTTTVAATTTTATPTTTAATTTTVSAPGAAQNLDIAAFAVNSNVNNGPVLTEWVRKQGAVSQAVTLLTNATASGRPSPLENSTVTKVINGTATGVFLKEQNYSDGSYKRLTGVSPSLGGDIKLKFQFQPGISSPNPYPNWDTTEPTIFFGGVGNMQDGTGNYVSLEGNDPGNPDLQMTFRTVTFTNGVRTESAKTYTSVGQPRSKYTGKWTWFKINVNATNKTFSAKVWLESESEPAGWTIVDRSVPTMVAGFQGWGSLDGWFEVNHYSATPQQLNNDSTSPTVTLTSSSTNVTTAGNIVFTATANDNVAVSKVDFYRVGAKLGTVTTPVSGNQYQYTSAVSYLDNGTYLYKAIAFDEAGNTKEATVSVVINIPAPTTAATTTFAPGSAQNLDIASLPYNTNIINGPVVTQWKTKVGTSVQALTLKADGDTGQPVQLQPSSVTANVNGTVKGVYLHEQNYSGGAYKRLTGYSPSVGGEIKMRFQFFTDSGNWDLTAPTLYYGGTGDGTNGTHFEASLMGNADALLYIVTRKVVTTAGNRVESDVVYNSTGFTRADFTNKWTWFKVNVDAAAQTVSAKAWLESASEPTAWQATRPVTGISAGFQGWSSLDGWFELNHYSSVSNATTTTAAPTTTLATTTAAPTTTAATTTVATTTVAPTTTVATTTLAPGSLAYKAEYDFYNGGDDGVLSASRGPAGTIVQGPVVYSNKGLAFSSAGPTAKSPITTDTFMTVLVNFELTDPSAYSSIFASDGVGAYVAVNSNEILLINNYSGPGASEFHLARPYTAGTPSALLISYEGTTVKVYDAATDTLLGQKTDFNAPLPVGQTVRFGNRYSLDRVQGTIRYVAVAQSSTAGLALTPAQRATMYANMNAEITKAKNPPTLTITPSSTPVTAEGVFTINAVATDSGSVAKVEFFRNNILASTMTAPTTGSTYTYSEAMTTINNGSIDYRVVATDNDGKTAIKKVTIPVNIVSTPNNADVLAISGLDYDTNLVGTVFTEMARKKGPNPQTLRLLEDGNIAQPAGFTPSVVTKDIGGVQKGVYLGEINYSDGSFKRLTAKPASLGGEMLMRYQRTGTDWNAGEFSMFMGGTGDMTNGSFHELSVMGNTEPIATVQIRKTMFVEGVYSTSVIATLDTTIPKEAKKWYWTRIKLDAPTKKMYARVWQDGTAEPTTWTLSGVDVPTIVSGYQGWGSLDGWFETNYYSTAPQGGTA